MVAGPIPNAGADGNAHTSCGASSDVQFFVASGRSYVDDPPALPFATDFGAVTRVVPAALVGVGRPEGWSFHTPEGEAQFASEAGLGSAMGMAEVLALATTRLLDPA